MKKENIKKYILKEIDNKVLELNEKDIESHIWWNKFSLFINKLLSDQN